MARSLISDAYTNLPAQVALDIFAMAERAYPNECCGLVVDGVARECRNVAREPQSSFAISAADYAGLNAIGRVQCVFHSHTDDSYGLSLRDLNASRALGVPYYVVTYPQNVTELFDPDAVPNLIGRSWRYGMHDCYSLVRDWYWLECGLDILDFDRGVVDPEDADGVWDEFRRHFPSAGFREVEIDLDRDRPNYGDMLLMAIESDYPNHCAVYCDHGGNSILQHCRGKLSRPSVYGGYWRNATTHVIRHESLC